jgi:hypothetical protein
MKNPDDTVAISALDYLGEAAWRRKMSNLVRYRAMESLCRQSAVFRPLESWRLLAEAEMWHHKAQEEMAFRSGERADVPLVADVPSVIEVAQTASDAPDESLLLAS